MNDKNISVITRRDFIRRAACAAVGTAAMTCSIRDLRLMNAAVAQSNITDYKALVCIFLQGGNDSNNLIIATIPSEYASYAAIRTPVLAIPQGSLFNLQKPNTGTGYANPPVGDPNNFVDPAGHCFGFHPGGPDLFCISGVVGRSKKRSPTTGHKSDKTRPTSLKGRMATVRQRTEQPVSPLSIKEVHNHFKRTLADSKWQVLKGWHVLRHSFISACATNGTDQRLLDEWCGHSTEQQRKRYRHLWPDKQQQAILKVFGRTTGQRRT